MCIEEYPYTCGQGLNSDQWGILPEVSCLMDEWKQFALLFFSFT